MLYNLLFKESQFKEQQQTSDYQVITYNQYTIRNEKGEVTLIANELGSTCGDCVAKQFCGPRRPFRIIVCTKTKVYRPGLAEIPAPVGSPDMMSQLRDYPSRQ